MSKAKSKIKISEKTLCGECGSNISSEDADLVVIVKGVAYCDEDCWQMHDSRLPVMVNVGGVNWELLREQKQALLTAIDYFESMSDVEAVNPQELVGLLHLIDHIQDEAAKSEGEEAIFGAAKKE